MNSNDFLLLERPSIVEVSRNIAAGDARASFGAKYNTDRWFASGYLTGDSWGTSNSASRTRSQIGTVLRAAGRPVATDDWDLHLGFSGSYVPEVLDTNSGETLRLRDFPRCGWTPGGRSTQATSTPTRPGPLGRSSVCAGRT